MPVSSLAALPLYFPTIADSAATGIDGITLMENAGVGCVNELMKRNVKSAVICTGSGNNAGDGFVIARLLANAGIPIKIMLCCPAAGFSGDALTNYQRICQLDVPLIPVDNSWNDSDLIAELQSVNDGPVDWIVDAMLGTGASGNPRPPMDRVIQIANQTDAGKMAVDIPSGMDCESGLPGDPTFCADVTCTFVTPKTGFRQNSASNFLGDVVVIDIGVPTQIVADIVAETSNGTSDAV